MNDGHGKVIFLPPGHSSSHVDNNTRQSECPSAWHIGNILAAVYALV